MPSAALRFLHTSDWHLDRVVGGLVEVPDHLRGLLREAPAAAVARLIDVAIDERCDFVLLAGDVIDAARASGHAWQALLDAFERLAAAGIAVYWSPGEVDLPASWPAALTLPPNVHRFAAHGVTTMVHLRGTEPVATIVGGSLTAQRGEDRPGRRSPVAWPARSGDHPQLAVFHGSPDASIVAASDIDYWALGGAHAPLVISDHPARAAYAGTPQGRSSADAGPRGGSLVELDRARKATARFVPARRIEYLTETIELTPPVAASTLSGLLADRTLDRLTSTDAAALLMQFRIAGPTAALEPLLDPRALRDAIDQHRIDFGWQTPPSWCTNIELDPSQALAAECNREGSLLGEILRAIARHGETNAPLDLSSIAAADAQAAGSQRRARRGVRARPGVDEEAALATASQEAAALAGLTRIEDPAARAEVIARAARRALGAWHGATGGLSTSAWHPRLDQQTLVDKPPVAPSTSNGAWQSRGPAS